MGFGDPSVKIDQVLKTAMFAGLVSKKTCECHAGSSGRFHFCHAGDNCDTTHGLCQKQRRN